MSNLKKHMKTDRIKWIATAIAFILLSATVVGMSLQLFGNGKQKPSEWFKKADTQIEQTDEPTPDNDNVSAVVSFDLNG